MGRAVTQVAVCLVAVAGAVLLLSCGGDDAQPGRPGRAGAPDRPTEIPLPGPPGTRRGRDLIARTGCLGCHRIDAQGNGGPGPDLSHVAGRLSRAQIERYLVDPAAPMPSYKSLPAHDRAEIARYLAALR